MMSADSATSRAGVPSRALHALAVGPARRRRRRPPTSDRSRAGPQGSCPQGSARHTRSITGLGAHLQSATAMPIWGARRGRRGSIKLRCPRDPALPDMRLPRRTSALRAPGGGSALGGSRRPTRTRRVLPARRHQPAELGMPKASPMATWPGQRPASVDHRDPADVRLRRRRRG